MRLAAVLLSPAVAAVLLVATACGTSELPTDDGGAWAQAGILLGDWVAVKNEHQQQANPTIVAQVADTFTLSVTSDGRYEAALILTGAMELGWIRVEPPAVTFRPTQPPGEDDPATLLVRGDTMVLTGDSEFNFGAGLEPSILTLDLVAR